MNHRVALVLLVAALPVRAATPAPRPTLTFEQHVRPIFKAHCLECHGEAKKLQGGLDVRLRRTSVQGGDKGPAIVPGKPGDSLLYQRVREHQMPPGKVKLSGQEIDRIREWISAGAPASRAEPGSITPGL